MNDLGIPQLVASKAAFEQMKDRSVPFSVSFFKSDGHFVELSDCVRIPNKSNLEHHKYVTVVPIDGRTHPYPIFIRLIEEFNGKIVYQG
jgi:hypothetical protein